MAAFITPPPSSRSLATALGDHARVKTTPAGVHGGDGAWSAITIGRQSAVMTVGAIPARQ